MGGAGMLAVALVASALVAAVDAKFKSPMAQVFNTWDLSKGRQYVKSFDHLAVNEHYSAVQGEHARQKRHAELKDMFRSVSPITKVCERPGYTGQNCEFPICEYENPIVDPDQFETDTGFYIDVTEMTDCLGTHTMLIDDTLSDIRIEVEADKDVFPNFVMYNASGDVMTSETHHANRNTYDASYRGLPAGTYFLIPATAQAGAHCVLTSTGHTHLTISGGFSLDGRERSDFPNAHATVGVFNSIILTADKLRSPGKLVSVSVLGPNNYVFRPRLLETRYGCSYEYYFDSFICATVGPYALTVEGVDHKGNLFRRGFTFGCLNGPAPTASTPAPVTSAPPAGCKNGGIMLKRPSGAEYCMCAELWAGNDCSDSICVNGGTFYTDSDTGKSECICPIGFHGIHCQEVNCEEESDMGFGVDRPTLVLVVRVRKQMNAVVKQIKDAITNMFAELQNDPDYMSRFQMIFFFANRIVDAGYYTNIDQATAKLDEAATTNFVNGNCSDGVFGALAAGILNEALTYKSQVYIITDALANDHDDNLDTIFQYNSFWRATINFVLVDAAADSGAAACKHDVSDAGFRAFQELSGRFSGIAWHVTDPTKFGDSFYAHLRATFYRTQLMVVEDREECSKGLLKTVQIESTSENLIIVGRGLNFFPFVTDPMGNSVQLTQLSYDGIFGVWRIYDPALGQYIIKAKTDGAACSFRVYQGAYKINRTTTPPELFWAISDDVDKDIAGLQPLSLTHNHPVFHLTEFETRRPERVFSALNIYTVKDGAEVEVYASNGIYRERCSYNFYFPAFQCHPDQLLHFEFFLRDNEGFYIQRSGSMYCTSFHPTPVSPDGCLHGGVMTSNNTCLCQPHFSGDHCQIITCEHGGVQDGDRCKCATGWMGPHCNFPVCHELGPRPSYGRHVDMAFVFEYTTKGIDQIKYLLHSLPGILRDVTTQHHEWIDRFVLVAYNSTWADVLVDVKSNNYKPLLAKLVEMTNNIPSDETCVVQTWEALRRLLREREGRREFPKRSIVNLYEAGIPDTFDSGLLSFTVSNELLDRFVTMNVFQAQPTDGSQWYCHAQEHDFVALQKAARRGDGHFYTLRSTDTGRAGDMIPTFFSSSIVYKTQFKDCTAPQNVYFPIDSHTQTISAVVAGYNAVIDLKKFDGTSFGDDTTRVEVFENEMTQVTEFRNPCDQDWIGLGPYCMRFTLSLGYATHHDALAFCVDHGAYLIDDLTDAKNEWLAQASAGQHVWLGLQLINGQWCFQHDVSTCSPVIKSYWSGGVVPNDPAKACAYFDGQSTDGYWKNVACTDNGNKFLVACQRHRFDPDNTPSQIGDDDISPGKYILTVQTAAPPANIPWKGCGVEIHVQSDLNLEWGFINGMRGDEPVPFANVDSDANRLAGTISIGDGIDNFAFLRHVMMRTDDENSTLLEASPFHLRQGCNYNFYSDKLTCEETGGQDFQLVTVGEDESGNTFQRYTTSFCTLWVYECHNEGIYNNGGCICDEYFMGTHCEIPICQNEGVLSASGRRCDCKPNYQGAACQHPTCNATTPATAPFSNDDKSLVIIIESSKLTHDAIVNLANDLPNIVQKAQEHHHYWFNTYIVHSFFPDGSRDDIQLLLSPQTAADHLKDVANGATQEGKCEAPLFEAMKDIFTYASLLDGAEVLLITAAVPLDHDIENMHSAMEQFGVQSPIVDYIHIETAACPVMDWKTNLTTFGLFGQSTGGVLFRTSTDNIAASLEALLPTRYAPQRLSYSSPTNCKGSFYVQVDVNMTNIYISLNGKNAKVWAVTPKMELIVANPIITTKEQNLWSFVPSYPGLYQLTVQTDDAVCFPYVWGHGGVQVVFGFVQDSELSDKPTPYAVYGVKNYPVFSIIDPDDSPYGARGRLYFSNMVRQKLDGSDESPYRKDALRRRGCTYQYVADSFLCAENNEAITISVSGMDTFRQPFTRQSTTWCKNGSDITTIIPTLPTRPTRLPPVTTKSPPVQSTSAGPAIPTTTTRPMTPKDIPFDIIFLIDETENEKFAENVANQFILNVMSMFSVDQDHARVGLMTLPAHYSQTMPVTFLSAITSWDSLLANLNEVDDFSDQGSQEWITQALKFAQFQYRKLANGYRYGVNNHLIVLITETTSFNATDIAEAVSVSAAILKDNIYGIVGIAYGDRADSGALSKFTGSADCVTKAANSADLNGAAVKFVQDKIWRAYNTTGGAYCNPPAASSGWGWGFF